MIRLAIDKHKLPDYMVDSHNNKVGKLEYKFVHPDGREAIYDGNTGLLVTESKFRGTFNFVNPRLMTSVNRFSLS